jgi:hypothetical protein
MISISFEQFHLIAIKTLLDKGVVAPIVGLSNLPKITQQVGDRA